MHVARAGARFVRKSLLEAAYELNFPLPLRTRIGLARRGTLQKIALIAPDLSFVYVPIPKAANSTIKRILLALYRSSPPESNHEALHSKFEPYRTIPQLSRTEMDLAFLNPRTYRFTFVRNPYARLLSACRDKIVDTNRRDYGDHYAKKLKLSSNATFEQFVLMVADQPDCESDWHWMSQTRCAVLNLIDYRFIGRVESLASDMTQVLSSIAPNSPSENPIGVNRTDGYPSANAYTERLAEIVFHRYHADFDNFKYDPAGWKAI